MASPLEDLLGRLSGDQVARLSAALGTDRKSTEQAVGSAVPMLFSALAARANRPEGAQALAGALDRDHDGSVLDDVAGFFTGAGPGPGQAILGHVLGGQQAAAEAHISRASGLDSGAAGRLLAMLAPLVMGSLGRVKRSQGLDPSALSDLLGQERRQAAAAAPAELGGLMQLLDADGDGSVIDDAAKLGSRLLSGFLKGR